jgi:CBS domain containing-hemolysin-like protein
MEFIGWLILKLLVVAVLVLLNGFFVAAEFALVKIRDTQLEPLIDKGHKRARRAHALISNLDASLSACQLGITLASLGLGWVGEPVFAALLEPLMRWLQVDSPDVRRTAAFLTGFSAITFLHIVVGEQAPKVLAIQKALPTSLWIAYPLQWFYRASYPAIWALNNASLWVLRSMGIQPASEHELTHSEDELRLLLGTAQRQAGATQLGREIVLNALDLRQRVAREVMRPRQEIVFLDTEAPVQECLDLVERTRFSRFPLCERGDLDKTLGVVHLKDIFALRQVAQRGRDFVPQARPIIYVPQTARLERLLNFFLERRLHFAIVVDEFGGTVGMLTLENILEELVGQIQDEFDMEKPRLLQTGEDSWEVRGDLPVHDLAELVGEALEEEGVTTTSGWVTQRLGGFPKTGNTLSLGAYTLRVEEMNGLRVERLRLERTK